MNKQSFSFLVVGVLLGSIAASIGYAVAAGRSNTSNAPGGTTVTVLSLAHSLPESHPVHAGMVFMQQRLAELSNGTVELKVFANGLLGDETACLEQVQQGTLDITKTSTAPLAGFVPAMDVFGLPYLFRDRDHFWQTLDGPIGQDMLTAGQSHGLVGLAYYDAGSRNFYTTHRPIQSPDDLTGMKIRVQRSETAMRMVDTLGGTPTPIPWGELYTALQQGMVDGAENNPPSYVQNNHHEVAKYFTFSEHTRVPDVLIMNANRLTSLTPQTRAWLQQAAAESSVHQRQLWVQASQRAIDVAEQAGVQVFRPDRAPFFDKVTDMLNAVENPTVRETLQRIRGGA